MKHRTVLWALGGAAAATLLAATLVSSQTPDASGFTPTRPPARENRTEAVEPARAPAPHLGAAQPRPEPRPEPTIDDLLARLDSIKAQKAALERAEKETVSALAEKLKQQRERMRKLGVHLDEHDGKPVPGPSPVVGDNH